jgi:hypothetical protein
MLGARSGSATRGSGPECGSSTPLQWLHAALILFIINNKNDFDFLTKREHLKIKCFKSWYAKVKVTSSTVHFINAKNERLLVILYVG